MSVQGLQRAWDALAADAEAIAALPFARHERRDAASNLVGEPSSPTVNWSAITVWLIDPDNILHDSTLWRRWLVQLLGRLGVKTRYRTFWAIWEEDFLEPVQRGERRLDEAFRAFLLSLGLTRGQADEVFAAGVSKRRCLEQGTRPLPGAAAALARLRESGARVCVLANADGDAAEVDARLANLGLKRHVDRVLACCEWKSTLLDASSYVQALAAIGVEAAATGFVSGHVDRIAAAANCGVRTVAVYPDRLPPRADAVLSRLDEIVSLLHPQSAKPHVSEGVQ